MKVKSEREVAQSCPTPSNPMDCSLPGSSVHWILQARVLEWDAIAFFVSCAKILISNLVLYAKVVHIFKASSSWVRNFLNFDKTLHILACFRDLANHSFFNSKMSG